MELRDQDLQRHTSVRLDAFLGQCLAAWAQTWKRRIAWTDPRLGCCQAYATILGTEAIGKRGAKPRTRRSGSSERSEEDQRPALQEPSHRESLEHVAQLLEKTLKDKWREEDLRWDRKADLGRGGGAG